MGTYMHKVLQKYRAGKEGDVRSFERVFYDGMLETLDFDDRGTVVKRWPNPPAALADTGKRKQAVQDSERLGCGVQHGVTGADGAQELQPRDFARGVCGFFRCS